MDHDLLFSVLFLSQGRAARRTFKNILVDHNTRKNGGMIVMSDQGSSKTVLVGSVIYLFMSQKKAYNDGYIESYLFDNFVFLSFSASAKSQVIKDFDDYLPKIDDVFISTSPDFYFRTVGENKITESLQNLEGNTLMIIDEPQKGFSMSDIKQNSRKESALKLIVTNTPNVYKIFVTATPMKNSKTDMSVYLSVFLNKSVNDVYDDILDPNSYKNRIVFIPSEVVNFNNVNIIYTNEEREYSDNIKKSIINGFVMYITEDNPIRFLNTTRIPYSSTQITKMCTMVSEFDETGDLRSGFNSDFIKLDSISGKDFSSINGSAFSEEYDHLELFEISPKAHFIINNELSRKRFKKSIVNSNNYAGIFIADDSGDDNMYLFDYFKKYKKFFVEYKSTTKEVLKGKIYYINAFTTSNKTKKTIEMFNNLPENNNSPIICFLPERFATGFTYIHVLTIYLWIFSYHYTGASQMFGRISRNNCVTNDTQEVYILESDISLSSDVIIDKFNKCLVGNLKESDAKKYKKALEKYYDGETNKKVINIKEKLYRNRYRAMYAPFIRKKITLGKLDEIAEVEALMLDNNILLDIIGESNPNQLFPKRYFRKEGIYHRKKMSYTADDVDGFGENLDYAFIFLDYIKTSKAKNPNVYKCTFTGDSEVDDIYFSLEGLI